MRAPICAILIVILGGCVDHNAYLSGAIDARVVDRVSHAPVVGAKASLRSPEEDPAAVAEAATDIAGRFQMGPLRGRHWAFGDTIVKPPLLRIEANGYEPFVLELRRTDFTVERFANSVARPPDDILLDPKR